ncbi:hypothetical protein B4113_1120 [Geobacillus sp. B4113_201601]|nr:hypothetical protein B4113_1120 [Geobacillus sp. B4113_201601]
MQQCSILIHQPKEITIFHQPSRQPVIQEGMPLSSFLK